MIRFASNDRSSRLLLLTAGFLCAATFARAAPGAAVVHRTAAPSPISARRAAVSSSAEFASRLGFSTSQTAQFERELAAARAIALHERDATRRIEAAAQQKGDSDARTALDRLHAITQQELTTIGKQVLAGLTPTQRKTLTDELAKHGGPDDPSQLEHVLTDRIEQWARASTS